MEILGTFLADKLEGINIFDAIDFAVKEHHTELEDLNTLQLDEGSDTEGKSLGDYRNIAYKGRLRPVDLKNTGAFRKGLKVKSKGGVIEMDSLDKKTVKLTERYGDNIIGIPKKDIKSGEVGEILLGSIITEVRRQINV